MLTSRIFGVGTNCSFWLVEIKWTMAMAFTFKEMKIPGHNITCLHMHLFLIDWVIIRSLTVFWQCERSACLLSQVLSTVASIMSLSDGGVLYRKATSQILLSLKPSFMLIHWQSRLAGLIINILFSIRETFPAAVLGGLFTEICIPSDSLQGDGDNGDGGELTKKQRRVCWYGTVQNFPALLWPDQTESCEFIAVYPCLSRISSLEKKLEATPPDNTMPLTG